AGAGGRPMRSKEIRRSRARLDAGGAGHKPFCSIFESTKLSMGFCSQELFTTFGMVGALTLVNGQARGLSVVALALDGKLSIHLAILAISSPARGGWPIGIAGFFSPRT